MARVILIKLIVCSIADLWFPCCYSEHHNIISISNVITKAAISLFQPQYRIRKCTS